MSGKLSVLFAILLLASTFPARSETPVGDFDVVNSAGFVQQDGVRTPLDTDQRSTTVEISPNSDGSLTLDVTGSKLSLFPIENGLAALEWDAAGTTLLHGADIQAVLEKTDPSDIPVWGALIAWPGIGIAQMVMLPLGERAYTGFLISQKDGRKTVRQMEFRQVFGPGNRP